MEPTKEQQKYDELMQELERDFQRFSQNVRKTINDFRTLFQFEHNGDAIIQTSNQNRLLTFGNAEMDYNIIDADYVESSQAFDQQMEIFEQFYQKEKEGAIKHLAALGIDIEPEVAHPVSLQHDVAAETEPYSQAWLQNPENANWELHWDNGYHQNHAQYESQDLYQTHQGDFFLHISETNRTHNMTVSGVKEFVFDKFPNPESILEEMEIEVDQASLTLATSTPLSSQEQLLNRVETEFEDFKAGMKEHTKDDMMNPENTYEIMVKTEIVHHVRAGYISDDVVNTLLESENLLDDIYQIYTENDSNQFFDPIQSAITNHIEKYQGLNEEPAIASAVLEPTTGFVRKVPETSNHYTYNVVDEMELEGHELEANKRSFLDDVISVTEQEVIAEIPPHEAVNSDSAYIEVQETTEGYLPADELNADGVGNMKKHKARTNLKDFGYKGLE